jgi:SAM-dependent methyltransferase
VTCPACGSEAAPWLSAPAGEPGNASIHELVRCPACGTAATAGAAPGRAAYATGVYSAAPPRLGRLLDFVLRLATRLPLRALRRAGIEPAAAVLDAGAGRGRLVAALREGGYHAEGIDPWPRGQGIAQASVAAHEAEGLDAVVLWHVLEHVVDPLAALERVRGWLRPGGVVLVGTPNLDSFQARIAGPAWFHLDLPRHRTHFTPEGGSVTVSSERYGKTCRVLVTDTGIGIPLSALPHVFDRFYRVDAARGRAGAGLGLSIAQWIVEEHGGEIFLKSVPDQGTTAVVEFPVGEPVVPGPVQAAPAVQVP